MAAKQLVEQDAESKAKEIQTLKDQITAAQEDSNEQSEEKEALKLEKTQIQDTYEK